LKSSVCTAYFLGSHSLFPFPEQNMERDKFLSADEAKDFGLTDQVLVHPPQPGEESS
jgi:ATP-dependent protease ClpP protease subunit